MAKLRSQTPRRPFASDENAAHAQTVLSANFEEIVNADDIW
jgi:hypothetical protein